MCMFGDRLDAAVKDVVEITRVYMETTLLIPTDDVHWELSNGCQLVYHVESPPELVIWPIFGGVVGGMGAIFLVLCIVFIWYKTRPVNLSHLPQPVRWQYEQYYIASSSGWVQDKSKKFFKKKLASNSEEYERMKEFFYGLLGASSKIKISEAYAIFNPMIVTNFANYHNTITQRMTDLPTIFAKQDWRLRNDYEAKELAYGKYLERCKTTGWNDSLKVPILLTCHVTDFNIAMAISATGFSFLSSVDAGWYGSGVYFTSYATYACMYFTNRVDPALLISFVTLGNTYPVTESHTGSTSLAGNASVPGYNAHYVNVCADGTVPDWKRPDSCSDLFDEIVVSQEPQIAPVYLIRLRNKNLTEALSSTKNGNESDPPLN
eukprot:TRINITY_DN6093_c0_g2_i1.p1 TRINITY_DN6093_c0_g2~~TRINITY_DN6093_c0_g2_i1.p1  ORF type:complete len:377 (-),score=54.01 TRINITY_DN6093_c0_g2_i1:62-1192(-)